MKAGVLWLGSSDRYGTGFVLSKKHRLVVTNAHVADGVSSEGSLWASVNGSLEVIPVAEVWYHPGVIRELDHGLRVRSPNAKDGPLARGAPDVAVVRLADESAELSVEWVLADPKEMRSIADRPVAKVGFGRDDDRTNRTPRTESDWATVAGGVATEFTDFDGHAVPPLEERQELVSSIKTFPGDSGAPIFLENGHVIGVLYAGGRHARTAKGETESYAIRIDCLQELLAYHGLDRRFGLVVDRTSIRVPTYPSTDPRIDTFRKAVASVKRARELLRRDDYKGAGAHCNEALRMLPEYWFAHLIRAKIYLAYVTDDRVQASDDDKRKFVDWAKADAEKCSRAGVEVTEAYLVLSRSQLLSNTLWTKLFHELVIKNSNGVLSDQNATQEQRAFALANRGQAKRGLGDIKGALADINEAIRLAPAESGWYRDRALLWERLGRPDLIASDRRQVARLRAGRQAEALREKRSLPALPPPVDPFESFASPQPASSR